MRLFQPVSKKQLKAQVHMVINYSTPTLINITLYTSTATEIGLGVATAVLAPACLILLVIVICKYKQCSKHTCSSFNCTIEFVNIYMYFETCMLEGGWVGVPSSPTHTKSTCSNYFSGLYPLGF